MKIAKIVFCIGVILTLAVMAESLNYLYSELAAVRVQLDQVSESLVIISPRQFQEKLNEIEPEVPIETDGIIGPATIAKWERIYCNFSAIQTFKELKK